MFEHFVLWLWVSVKNQAFRGIVRDFGGFCQRAVNAPRSGSIMATWGKSHHRVYILSLDFKNSTNSLEYSFIFAIGVGKPNLNNNFVSEPGII